jgi:hypothetical protein
MYLEETTRSYSDNPKAPLVSQIPLNLATCPLTRDTYLYSLCSRTVSIRVFNVLSSPSIVAMHWKSRTGLQPKVSSRHGLA